MPAPTGQRYRVTFGGSVGAGPWNTSVWNTTDISVLPNQSDVNACASAIGTLFLAGPGNLWKVHNLASTIFDSVRIDVYQSGSMASAMNGSSSGFGLAGTASLAAAASQCIVNSLYTANNSRRGRGRMYWPATGALPSTAQPYGFDPTQINSYGTSMATFISDLGGAFFANAMGNGTAVVQSLTAGLTFPITQLLIDTRPDRQEHREKALLWQRFSHAV